MDGPSPLAYPTSDGLFQTRPAIDAVLRQGRVTELNAASADGPTGFFDGEDLNILVQGDLVGMQRIKGQRSLLVEGDVRGDADAPCRIEVGGDVIVTGGVYYAEVVAEGILVGESVAHSNLTAGTRVHISGDVDQGRIETGNYNGARKRIDSCSADLERAQERAESLRRRVIHHEKRMAKACQAVSIPLDFNVGRIVTHAEGRVSVDLSSFYRSLEERPEAQLEVALSDFFAKGVVGVVARANRKYLVDYPAREKVFMQLLRSLRELFLVVADRDRTLQTLEGSEAELEQLLVDLAQRQPEVAVGGRIAPPVEMEFILPQVARLPDGGVDFPSPGAASLCVCAGTSFGRWEIVVKDAAGARSVQDASNLRGVVIRVDDDGRVRWHTAVPSPEAEPA